MDLYFKDFIFKVYAPVVLLQHIRSFIERKETLRILLTQHIGLLDHYTVSIHLRQAVAKQPRVPRSGTLSSPLENSSSTGIELMNIPSHTAVCDNLSIVITVVCIHWSYIRYGLLAPFIKMSDKFQSFRNGQNIDTIDTLNNKVKNNVCICAICLLFIHCVNFQNGIIENEFF